MVKDWKERVLTIGIAIIFVLFVGYSINTFLKGDKGDEQYTRNLFIVAGISGIVGIIIGVLITVESVGAGLIGGGILSLLYGIIVYWNFAENLLRVLILGIALGVLVWLGYNKFGKYKNNVAKNFKK